MIQDISPYEFHNEFTGRLPQPDDTVFLFKGRSVLCFQGEDGTVRFPSVSDLPGDHESLIYLFEISDQYYYLMLGGELEKDSFSFVSLMDLRSEKSILPAFASLTAFHLYTWYDKNRFCGKCGKARLVHDTQERMLKCPECGNMVFPVIAPAVIVGVRWGEKLLMTKYAGREYGGWALIAGFCEIGETVEDTVHREVMEEAGLHVRDLQYVASQPWGSDSNILMGYFCDVDGDFHIHMDSHELSRAVWVDRADVPYMGDNLSLTGHMIEMFRKGEA